MTISIHYKIVCLLFAMLFGLSTGFAQRRTCYNGTKKSKPYLEIFGYPKSAVLNLLDREYIQELHFGFGLGLNLFDFSIIDLSKETVYIPGQGNMVLAARMSNANLGFNINAIMDYRLVRNLNIRLIPGIFFGQRQLMFVRTDNNAEVITMPIASNYMEAPLLLKYGAERYNNFRPYVIGGANMRLNLSNRPSEEAGRYIGLKKLEPFAEIGIGFDFYKTFFRLSIEAKMSAGLTNCLSNEIIEGQEQYRKALTGLRSNMMVFSVNFEM